MVINFNYSNNNLQLSYDRRGILDYVKNLDTGEYMMLDIKVQGTGYEIHETSFMIGGTSRVCDARYVRIMQLDVFVPKFIFIPNVDDD